MSIAFRHFLYILSNISAPFVPYSELNCTFAPSHADMLENGAVVWVHVHKGVTVRFGFDAVRTSQLQSICQEQSNGNAPWDVYIQSALAIDEMVDEFGILYIHQRGAFGVARFDRLGQCEGLYSVERVTDWLHVFLYMYKSSS